MVTVNPAAPPPNQAPVTSAGSDIFLLLPVNSATLNGTGTDPDGTITSYQWAKISGPATYSIVSPASAVTDIQNLVEGVYEFELSVTDNSSATTKDTVKVTVNGNVERQSRLTVYPNPATDIINIKIPAGTATGQFYITIYNLRGLTVYISAKTTITQSTMTVPVDITRFGPGAYFVKINFDNGKKKMIDRFIKMRP
jgi:hypothetical protein